MTIGSNGKIDLIQPRHIYAPNPEDEPIGHIYMPTSLLAAASILLDANFDLAIHDENIEQYAYKNNVIGINLLGAPYISKAIQYLNNLKSVFKSNYLLILGGQVVSGLTDQQIIRLFGQNTINGNKYERLSKTFKVELSDFQKIENLSLIPAYSLLPDSYMRLYLSKEIGFYLSQGCKHSCTFCAAQRTYYDQSRKQFIKNKEIYRDITIAYKDLEFLILQAKKFQIKSLHLYLSNLDLFQNPSLLNQFAINVLDLKRKHNDFEIYMRGLSNVRSFLQTHKTNPSIIINMINAGLRRVGFGIDGATPKIWRENKKPQVKSECINAISILKNIYGLIPETLMVFGYNKLDNEISLKLSYEFAKDMLEKFGAIPRPHIAKDVIPGNDGWVNIKKQNIVNKLISNPILFQNLDFTAIPSILTHPDSSFREMVTKYYVKVCSLPSCLTQYVKPESSSINNNEVMKIRKFNLRRYDI